MSILIPLLIIGILVAVVALKIVNTGNIYVVERFGQYHRTLTPGWQLVIPVFDFVRAKISTKQQILEIPRQDVITKDNVKISIDNVIFYQVINGSAAIYQIEDYRAGIFYSTINNIRNIVGAMNLDEILSGRDTINGKLMIALDAVTEAYGVKVLSAEIRAIDPPHEIQEAMDKQLKAEREKRSIVLLSEGEKESAINKAQGLKESKILEAEAEKEANIRRAEGLQKSQELEAQGQAAAIKLVAEAEAGATLIKTKAILDAGTTPIVVALKQIDALTEMSKNPSSKLILPTDAVSSMGSIAAVAELIKK